MRFMALLLVTLAFAGCTSDEPTEITEPTENGGPMEHMEHHDSPWNVTAINGTFQGNLTEAFDNVPVFFNWTASYFLNGTETEEPFFHELVSIDRAGGNFSWAFDQDSDGTPEATGSLVPFNHTAIYLPGNHTATLTMSGHGQNWTGTHNVNVLEYIPPIPPTIIQGIVNEPCLLCSNEDAGWSYSISHLADTIDIDATWAEIPADLAGAPFVAVSTAESMGVSFQDTCNGAEVEGFAPADVVSGNVPEGAGCVWMWQEGVTRGTKLSFIAHGGIAQLPDDGMCWATNSIYLGIHETGAGFYSTDTGWGYIESNGVPGLQWTFEGNAASGNHKEGCENGDTILY